MKKIIVVIVLLIILSFGIVSAYGFHESEGNYVIQKICSVPMNGTGWDCSEYWGVVYYYDVWTIQAPNDKWLSGFAVYGPLVKDGEVWSLCHFFPEIRFTEEEICSLKWVAVGTNKLDGCWNYVCYPLIWHELKHLACECDWHDGMPQPKINLFLNLTKYV